LLFAREVADQLEGIARKVAQKRLSDKIIAKDVMMTMSRTSSGCDAPCSMRGALNFARRRQVKK
jgi:hypothetical protein